MVFSSPLRGPLASPAAVLAQRAQDDWLIGGDRAAFWAHFGHYQAQLGPEPRRILLAETDPVKFLAGFMAACAAGHPVFLANPRWADREWATVLEQVQPDAIWAEADTVARSPAWKRPTQGDRPPAQGILIPTGGSSGQIRFVVHTWETLIASVAGFQQHFQASQVNACCVLPLYHVSGLMQFLRAFCSGGQLVLGQRLEEVLADLHRAPRFEAPDFFLSLVPTQLQRALADAEAIALLRPFRAILLGGAPAWPSLLHEARRSGLPLAPTYGMTETASQIVTLRPADFLAGQTGSGPSLPHAAIALDPSDSTAEAPGLITIRAASLGLGYYGDRPFNGVFQPGDLGFWDDQGSLHVVGRQQEQILTGGENVFPAEVEAAIRATQRVADVAVVGLPDDEWGEVVVAVYAPWPDRPVTPSDLQQAIAPALSRFKQPKHWFVRAPLPRNRQGKLDRAELRAWAITQRTLATAPASAVAPPSAAPAAEAPSGCTHGASARGPQTGAGGPAQTRCG